jgi:hypothetical protein
MKKMRVLTIGVFVLALFFGGCASYDAFLPKAMKDLNGAIEKARLDGADKQCPKDFGEVVKMRDDALKIYYACRTAAGIEKAKAAKAKADALCPRLDSDGDGVFDDMDKCPGTPKGVKVDSKGCPLDTDGDGVWDYMDKCPGTPKGVRVDGKGCPLDTDGDGVYDYMDKCPGTPKGVKVDRKGCPFDTDGDGVYDYMDKCLGTPKGAKVDSRGCWVLKGVYFDTNKWNIKPQSYPVLNEAAEVLKRNPSLKVEIQGHTDSRGEEKYNQRLSDKRSKSVMEYFVNKGIGRDQLMAVGYGETMPISSNSTEPGRAKNRRVELQPIR